MNTRALASTPWRDICLCKRSVCISPPLSGPSISQCCRNTREESERRCVCVCVCVYAHMCLLFGSHKHICVHTHCQWTEEKNHNEPSVSEVKSDLLETWQELWPRVVTMVTSSTKAGMTKTYCCFFFSLPLRVLSLLFSHYLTSRFALILFVLNLLFLHPSGFLSSSGSFVSTWVKYYCTYHREPKRVTMVLFDPKSGGKMVSSFGHKKYSDKVKSGWPDENGWNTGQGSLGWAWSRGHIGNEQ